MSPSAVSSSADNHALIFGASGITGWAIANLLLSSSFPAAQSFSKVTALTNRPLKLEETLWPASDKLQMGQVNLMHEKGEDGVVEDLEKLDGIANVSHVYFFAYVMDPDPKKECEINVLLLDRAVKAAERLSKKIQFVVLPTGTKAYGVHLIEKFPFANDLPAAESLPRIPEPYASEMFYYTQLDYLTAASKGKSWTWCEVIPDVIIGFVPNNNIYCLPQILGLYLSLYRYQHGAGAEVPFPGTAKSWISLSNDSPQDLIAAFSIHASLNPQKFGAGQRFNTAVKQTFSWKGKWPIICEYFGLKGVPPPADGSLGPQPTAYLESNVDSWKEVETKYGLVKGRVANGRTYGGFPYFIMNMFDFDRYLDMTLFDKIWDADSAEAQFKEMDTKQSWWTAFDRFKKAKIIPDFEKA